MSTLIPLLSWNRICLGGRGFEPDGGQFVAEAPTGIRLEIEEARKSDVVLTPEMPWEDKGVGFAQVMKDGGMFRLWYAVMGSPIRVCYAESKDGFDWVRPELNMVEFKNSMANNLCRQLHGWEAPGIFVDTDALDGARYKTIYHAARWFDEHDTEISAEEGEKRWRAGKGGFRFDGYLCGAVSPDGLDWRELPEPLVKYFCDTQNVGVYDARNKRYVGFVRAHGGRARAVGIIESENFHSWSRPRIILQAGIDDPPDIDIYTNGYSPYPGTEDVHVMFPGIYHRIEDRVDARLAVNCAWESWMYKEPQFSWHAWEWVQRRAIIPNGPAGSIDEGGLYPGPGLIRLPDRRMGVICTCTTRLHNDPSLGRSACRWALWDQDRLAGIRTEKDGQFTIRLPLNDGPLRMNFRTEKDGWIEAELIPGVRHNPPRRVHAFKGFSFEDFRKLNGDSMDQSLIWKGGERPAQECGNVHLRLRMHKAKIFAFMT